MMRHARKVLRDQKGATAVEYSLILALVVLVVLGGIVGLGHVTVEMWNNIADQVERA